jgi:hypothetical protein
MKPGWRRALSDELETPGLLGQSRTSQARQPAIRGSEDEFNAIPGLIDYFWRRWKGEITLGQLVIRDTLVVGTLLNLLMGILALLFFSMDAAPWVAMLIFFLPLPYNLFLFGCIWRLSGRVGGWKGTLAAATGALWLLAATII